MRYEAFEDRNSPGDWRVEALDMEDEGQAYIAIFIGIEAKVRAEEYADWKNGNDIPQYRVVMDPRA